MNELFMILIYVYESINGVYVEIWNNTNYSGTVTTTTKYQNIFQSFTSAYLISISQLLCSGRYTTTLTVPQNDTYTIY